MNFTKSPNSPRQGFAKILFILVLFIAVGAAVLFLLEKEKSSERTDSVPEAVPESHEVVPAKPETTQIAPSESLATKDAPPPIPYPEIKRYEPWELNESAVRHTLHVATEHPKANDKNVGTEDKPFKTIQHALKTAFKTGSSDEGVRILIHPGTYRETLDLVSWKRNAPLLIEGTAAGEVIVSGSDVFADWKRDTRNPELFYHDWKQKFGDVANPWPGLMPMKKGESFRREMLFVNQAPYTQAFSVESLKPGTYFVDEALERVYMIPREQDRSGDIKVEISVRPSKAFGDHSKMLRIFTSKNVGIRKLVFEHAATMPFNSAALQVLGSSRILVEDCETRWNNGTGIAFENWKQDRSRDVILRRVKANNNGTMGLGGGFANGLIEDCETNGNNWRGAALGATGWAPCGFKLSGIHQVLIRNHVAMNNHASGGWFDDHISHIVIENFQGINNFRSGISLEAVDGPVLIIDPILMGNSVGFNSFDSQNIFVDGGIILNNESRSVRIAGSTPLSEEALAKFPEGWRRERLSKRKSPLNFTFTRSIIGNTREDIESAIFNFGMREGAFIDSKGNSTLQPTIDTLRLQGNTYWIPKNKGTVGFSDKMGQLIDLTTWQTLTGQDKDARWDHDTIKSALKQAVLKTGQEPTGFGVKDTTQGNSKVDELEL